MTIRGILKRLQHPYSRVEKSLYAHRICSSKGLCLPDFLGIGAQRSGTTWLYENLRQHPEIYLPDRKITFMGTELHYFDLQFHRSLRYYESKFTSGRQKVKGDITPAYGIIPLERIRFIRTIMPDVKLIFIMRNPIDRAWSQALMNLVVIPKRKYEDVDESEFYSHFQAARSIKRGDYGGILNNWLSLFPREQLYIGFFEDIKQRPKRLLTEVFTHIGVSRDVNWSSLPYKKIVNKNPDFPMPKRYREFLQEMYREDIELLYEHFGPAIDSWRCLDGVNEQV